MNVQKFNAKGDGDNNDRLAIQMAIDATIAAGGGVVFFPAGDYVVDKNPLPVPEPQENPQRKSYASFFIDRVTVPLVFEGEGSASIIRMVPGPHDPDPDRNWAMFRVFASKNVSFHHLLLHGNRRNITPPAEMMQIHCLLLDQALGVTVQNVEFQEAVDDGIRIMGAASSESRRLTIVENLFVNPGGNGITLDGSTTPTVVAFNHFEGIAQTPIHCKPSGGPVEDVVMQGNIIKHTSTSLAVSLDHTHRVQFVANMILGGEVGCGHLQDFVISNNVIVGGSGQGHSGLRLYGEAFHGFVTGNIIRAEPTSTGIEVELHGGQAEKIRLSHNTIVAGKTGINVVEGKDISVSDNVIESYGAGVVGINVVRNVNNPVDSIQIRNNHIRNFQYGIQAAGNRGNLLTRLVVVGNQTQGSTEAAIHISPGVPEATVYGNQADPGETVPLKLESGYIVTGAGFAGNGSPEGVVAAEVGSLYTRLDTDPVLPRLWVKETGADKTGWAQTAASFAGNGSPEGVVAARVGSLYTRLDDALELSRLWVKETGTDARGWAPVVTAPPLHPNPVSP